MTWRPDWPEKEDEKPAMWSTGRTEPYAPANPFGCASCGKCPKCGREIGEHKRRSCFGTPGYELVCPLAPPPPGEE